MNKSDFNQTFNDLAHNAPHALESNIGRIVRFKRPSRSNVASYNQWVVLNGTIARDNTFTIGFIQRDCYGNPCYRVFCNGYEDMFGRTMQFEEAEFLTNLEQ